MMRKFLSWIMGITLVISLAACASQRAGGRQGEAEALEIKEIDVSEWCCADGTAVKWTQITIVGNRPFTHREHQLSNPYGLLVQLKGVGLGKYEETMPIYKGAVTEIVPKKLTGRRWTAELRIGLTQKVAYRILEDRNRLIIALKDMNLSNPSEVQEAKPAKARNAEPSKVLQVIRMPASEPAIVDKPPTIQIPNDDTDDYVIGPEDILEILVWKNNDLSRIVTVRPDGNISLPLIGEVRAAGLSPEALRDVIVKRVSEYQIVPGVSIIVKEVNSYNVYVLGEVNGPGKYQLKSNTTLLQIISLAGGFTPFASRNDIKILRKKNLGSQEEVFKIRYKDIVSNEDVTKNLLLKPGDTIVVP